MLFFIFNIVFIYFLFCFSFDQIIVFYKNFHSYGNTHVLVQKIHTLISTFCLKKVYNFSLYYCCCFQVRLKCFFFFWIQFSLYFIHTKYTFTSFSLKPIKRNDFGRLHSDTYGCLTPHTTDRAWIIINDIIMSVSYIHIYRLWMDT